jgi:shikimate kinase
MARERIYIIGFMGSGKTTAGKKLARLLGWTFIDLDKQIEISEGMTIPDIFSEKGEEYFRKIESGLLKETYKLKNAVISTGGGAPCHGDNMSFLLGSGITVYLKLTPGQLLERLIGSKTGRPLIKGLGSEELLSYIKEKLQLREICYNRAEVISEEFNIDISHLKEQILQRI